MLSKLKTLFTFALRILRILPDQASMRFCYIPEAATKFVTARPDESVEASFRTVFF